MLRKGDIQLVAGKSFEYSYLRSRGCGIPENIKRMLIDIDDRKDRLFESFRSLPTVLCHREFWIENIFYNAGVIKLIDWDTAGWGFAGEDFASLIADETDAGMFEEYYRRLVPAYLKGLSEYMDVPAADELHIWEMILIKFGYRMVQDHMFSETDGENCQGLNALKKIYEIRV